MTTPKTATIKAAIYIRTSTAEQAERYGPAAQLAECKRYAQLQGLEVVKEYQDEVSGAQTQRPALQRLMADANKFQAVIVYHQDRLARDTPLSYSLLAALSELGLELHSASSGLLKRDTIFGILSVIAEDERRRILERTQSGRLQKALRGQLPSKVDAYGYIYTKGVGAVVVDSEAAQVVCRIFEEAAEGKSWRSIALGLSLEGIRPPRRVQDWNPNCIRYMVKNPVYRGEFVFGRVRSKTIKEPISIAVPAIVSPELWALAQRPTRALTSRTGQFALTGHIRCGLCGGTMSGKTTFNGWKHYKKYKCNRSGRVGLPIPCDAKEVPALGLEEEVARGIKEEVRKLEPPVEAPNNETKTRLLELEAEDARMLKAFRMKAITADELAKFRRELEHERTRLLKSKLQPQESIGVERLKEIAEGLPLHKLVRLTQARIIVYSRENIEVELFGGAA